jgi:hypothetical protein
MSAPWELDPAEKWARNFRRRVSAITDNAQSDDAADAYVAGVLEKAQGDVTESSIRDSAGYKSWLDAIETFSDEAIKRSTVVAAGLAEDYDSASEGQFEEATEVLGQKFIDNWSDHYS